VLEPLKAPDPGAAAQRSTRWRLASPRASSVEPSTYIDPGWQFIAADPRGAAESEGFRVACWKLRR
jgi:hypothetical protein